MRIWSRGWYGVAVFCLAGLASLIPRGAAADAPPSQYTVTNNGLPTGTVKDNKTGLIWQQPSMPAATWATATATCSFPWRLPSVKELQTIVDETRASPNTMIDPKAFPNTPAVLFWSSSTKGTNAFDIDFATGISTPQAETSTAAYRCVQ